MNYLYFFDDFKYFNESESYSFESDSLIESKINQMNSLKENCMASWDFSEFKNFLSDFINEGLSEEDNNSLMEKAYYTYELGILYEHKNEWFNSPGDIHYLEDTESETPRAILFKNNTIHIITGETLSRLKEGLDLLNEGWLSDIGNFLGKSKDRVNAAFNKYVKEPVKKAVSYVSDRFSKAWDTLSSGAKAVWEFSKKIVSAIAAFIKEEPLDAIAIGLMILSGIISFIPAAGTLIAPILMMIAGILQLITGTNNLIKAGEEVGEAQKVSDILKGVTKIIFGSASLLLGIKDVVTSASSALPGMGSIGVAIKSNVNSWAKNLSNTAIGTKSSKGIGAVLGVSEWMTEFFTTLCLEAPFMRKFIEIGEDGQKIIANKWITATTKAANKGTEIGVGEITKKENAGLKIDLHNSINEAEENKWGFIDLLVNFLTYIGKSCFSWLYDSIVGALSGIGKIINGLIDLPNKITKGINDFSKQHKSSFVGGIISGALSNFVKPFSKLGQIVIDKYVKPIISPITKWMTSLSEKNKIISDKIKNSKYLSNPTIPGVKDPGRVTILSKKINITDSDKNNIKKIGNAGVKTLVKAGGGSEKIVEKIDKEKEEFKKKFPGVNKLKGTWGQSPSGRAAYTIKSEEAEGSVTLFNDGTYTVISGPNKKARGEFKADKEVKLIPPKDGFKKNESLSYLLNFKDFNSIKDI